MIIIIFEDSWDNKTIMTSKIGNIGNDVVELIESCSDGFDELDFSIDKLNSDNPHDAGSFSKGFYDRHIFKDEEYVGRVMIFDISDEIVGGQ